MPDNNQPAWGQVISPLAGFITPPPFPPVYGQFNLTSYLQGASDYEIMCALLQVVKGLYDAVSTLQNNNNSYTDQEITKLRAYLDKTAVQLSNAIAQNDDAIRLLLGEQINALNARINSFMQYVDTRDLYYRYLEQIDISEVKALIEQLEKKLSSNASIFNLFEQNTTSVSQYFLDWYNKSRTGAATTALVDMSGRTVQYMDAQHFSAAWLDFNSSKREAFNYWRVFDPTTGEFVDMQVAFQHLSNFHRTGALTATQFDALDMTVDELDAAFTTAYNFDFNGVERS